MGRIKLELEFCKERVTHFQSRVSTTATRFALGEIDKEQFEYDTLMYNAILNMWVDSLNSVETDLNKEVRKV